MSVIKESYSADAEFLQNLDQYNQLINSTCRSLLSAVQDSRTVMKDEVSKDALLVIEELANELLAGIPDVESLVLVLKKRMKNIQEISELKFM